VSNNGLRGRSLERAITRAAARYRQQGICMLTKVPTPMATTRDGYLIPSGVAGPDFLGCLNGGRMLVIEAKECRGARLPLEHIPEHQRVACGIYAELGADVRLVVSFDDPGETYSIAWDHVADFLANRWRASLSLAWCRWRGVLVEEHESERDDRRQVLFLDARQQQPDRGVAETEVCTDEVRCRAAGGRIDHDEPEAAPPVRSDPVPMVERLQRIQEACMEGIARQAKARRGKARWNR
jgi:recombination protein U